MNRKWKFPVLALLGLLATGCVHNIKQLIDEPSVEFGGMEMKDSGVFSATPVFRFELASTNPMGLGIHGVAYDLKVNGRKFVKGVTDQTGRLPAAGTKTVSFPIPLSFLDLFGTMDAFRETETLPYELTGTIGVGPFAVPYSATGRFAVPGLPTVFLRGVRSGETDAESVELILDLELANPNPFSVRPRRIHYSVILDGRELARGAVGELPSVPAEGRAGVSVSVRVAATAAREVAERLADGRGVTYDVRGEVAFGPPRRGPRGLPFAGTGELRRDS
jgi:LEA14-like dessication related protein